MARKKTTLTALREWAMENNIIDEDVLAKRFYQCIEEPDPVESVDRIKKQKLSRFVASIRNKNGMRVAFPVKGKDGNTRIHIIPGTSDLEATVKIEERLTYNSAGNVRTRIPVSQWKAELAGQMALSFDEAKEKAPAV